MSTAQDCFSPLKWRYRVPPPEVIYGTSTHPIIVEMPKVEISPIDVPEAGAQPDPNRRNSLPTGVSFESGCALLPHPDPGSFIIDSQYLKNTSITLWQNKGYGPFGKGHIIIWDLGAGKLGDHFLRVWAHLVKDGQQIEGTFVFLDSNVFKVESEIPNPPRPVLSPEAMDCVERLLPLYPQLREARYFGRYLSSTNN